MLKGKLEVDRSRRYTIAETCTALGLSRKTLRKYTKSGDINLQVHSATGKIFYLGREIERFYNQTI